jgi:hypothetical protein
MNSRITVKKSFIDCEWNIVVTKTNIIVNEEAHKSLFVESYPIVLLSMYNSNSTYSNKESTRLATDSEFSPTEFRSQVPRNHKQEFENGNNSSTKSRCSRPCPLPMPLSSKIWSISDCEKIMSNHTNPIGKVCREFHFNSSQQNH